MTSSSSPGPRLPALLLGLLVLLLGLCMLAGGGYLATLGGSWYYLISGAALGLAGILIIARRPSALWLFALVLLSTTAWALWEVGLDWWQLVPRVALICSIGIVLLLPWWRRPLARGQRGGSLALLASVAIAALVAILSQFDDPQATKGRLETARAAGPVNPAQVSGEDWIAYGGTNAGTHYSGLDQITPENIGSLKEVWRIRTGDLADANSPPEITNQNTPLKVNDSLYICTSHSRVKALVPETGETKWSFDPEISTMGAEDFSGWAHMTCRGLAYYDVAVQQGDASGGEETPAMLDQTDVTCPRRLYLPTADARLIALNADTGERCASFGDGGEVDLTRNIGDFAPGGYYSTSPPTVTRDLVILGGHVTDNASTDEPSGVIRAFDARSGELVWNWDSGNPERTEPLAEDEVYTRNSPNVWAPISVDESLGLVYLPMGNATPDQYGADRSENDERYSAGLVALDLSTGQIRWHYQFVHHDLWDMDTPAQPVLIDLATADGVRQAVIQPTKQGSLYVLDRSNGEPIVPIDEVPAPQGAIEGDWTAATQPRSRLNLLPPELTEASMWGATPLDQMMCRIQFNSLRYEGQYTPPSLEGSIVYPGNVGVFNWSGIAIDPERQAIFTSPNYLAFVSRLVDKRDLPADAVQAAGEQGLQLNQGAPYAVELGPLLSVLGLPCQAPSWGNVAGVDLSDSSVKWMHRNGTARDSAAIPMPLGVGVPALGGPITTAGGVSFLSGTLDQYLRAYDITTGEELWKSRLPAGGQATPMTFQGNDGRQYVVVTAGGHGTFGTRLGDYVIGYALEQ
ncbi:glucose/quinate/shikimate family membrane-bound PQQ-dependent dehydrogenase [Halotalea alkalilenta]|uniref:Glucose dehydrogenase n=1 Tax=Halotalea alkalilenta TaxID=376489 RepID=A0A172YED2_9GAMM|nr:glucose/quinate/shikimate family membrane-bound PQQ-dependent dehydrogenase [Halotalea alkalilenta]ANF57325.1 glucose dehydrogenase [Halotalea alkalilenta]